LSILAINDDDDDGDKEDDNGDNIDRNKRIANLVVYQTNPKLYKEQVNC